MELKIFTVPIPDKNTLVVELTGDFTGLELNVNKERLDNYLHSSFKIFIFDLTFVHLMDSRGIGFIVHQFNRLSQAGKHLIILNEAKEKSFNYAGRMLSMVGLDNKLKMFDKLDEALLHISRLSC